MMNKFQNFINKIKDHIDYNRLFKTKLLPFINSANITSDSNTLTSTIYVSEKSLKELESVFNHKKDKLTNDEITKYKEKLALVNNHNNVLRNIEDNIKSFDYQSIIDNPYNINNEYIDKYKFSYYSLKTYKNLIGNFKIFFDQFDEVINNLDTIKEQYDIAKEIDNLYTEQDRYLDNDYLESLNNTYEELKTKFDKSGLHFYDIKKPDFDSLVKQDNFCFVKRHLQDNFFDNINEKSLDQEQRASVLYDEKSNLVIAGAGSGKTLTIVGKVKYLLDKENVNPKDILLLSYSKKSADDLERKIHQIDPNLNVGTFHKIGLEILQESTGKKQTVEEQVAAIIDEYFREEIFKSKAQLLKILQYYALFHEARDEDKVYLDKGELYKDLKSNDFTTLKDELLKLSPDGNDKTTLKREKVKSQEELIIANFYFLHGINYEYERPYKVDLSTADKRQYLPDFYLKDYDIYHEHFGLNRDGNAPQFGAQGSLEYKQLYRWKMEMHKQYQTKCIKTFSYNFQEKTIFDVLIKQLLENGVKINPIDDELVSNSLRQIYHGQHFKSFINLVMSFLNLFKSRYKLASDFDTLLDNSGLTGFAYLRAKLFLDIVKDVYMFYIGRIRSENKIDFDDMILQSIDALPELNNFKYKYIIVDEFQDISYSRMLFLKALIKHGNAKLFAVGDDWQAIYRFAGCDLNIFLNFEKYFGICEKTCIQTTHRNSQELQEIVGRFIRKNEAQLIKSIRSEKRLKDPIKIYYFDSHKESAFLQVLSSIEKKNPNAKILVLGRNKRDVEQIYSAQVQPAKGYNSNHKINCSKFPNLELTYSTVHASKGLEEDFTILINADDATLGFPNKVEDDPLLKLVLSDSDSYEYSEERRLFYVALTRTRSYCYILVNTRRPSIFIEEIKDYCELMNEDLVEDSSNYIDCPECHSGHLVLREHDGRSFYGCSNYPYCKYTVNDLEAVHRNRRCQVCGHFLSIRNGKYGKYYKCTNKRCSFTLNISRNRY